MNEEEKKAIDILNNVVADEVVCIYCIEIQKTTNCAENCKDDDCFIIKAIDTVVNLIDKQQKEIEKYKNVIDNGEFTWKQKYEETFEYVKENYISKDKIREIIYPSPDNYIPVEVQMSEMYRKIENLLKESEMNENNENN